jgi:REP element-mobilizing transposase RayT
MTVCSFRRREVFGRVTDGLVELSDIGKIAQQEWLSTADIRLDADLDNFIIMPNHLHAIVILGELSMQTNVGAHCNAPLHAEGRRLYRKPRSLGSLIALFKGAVTRKTRTKLCDPTYKVWQRNYYERVIRDEAEWHRVRQYIDENPNNWRQDPYFVA